MGQDRERGQVVVRVAGVRLRRAIDQQRNPRWDAIDLRWERNRDSIGNRNRNREIEKEKGEDEKDGEREKDNRETEKGEEDK